MPLSLEVQHLGRKHAPLLERPRDVFGNGAEVFTNDERVVTNALERENAQKVLRRICDIHAFRTGSPFRNPEQSEQSHHVVDAQCARMSKAVSDEIDEVPIPISPERSRIDRRKSPVLSVRGVWDPAARRRSRRERTARGMPRYPRPRASYRSPDPDRVRSAFQPARAFDAAAPSCRSISNCSQR